MERDDLPVISLPEDEAPVAIARAGGTRTAPGLAKTAGNRPLDGAARPPVKSVPPRPAPSKAPAPEGESPKPASAEPELAKPTVVRKPEEREKNPAAGTGSGTDTEVLLLRLNEQHKLVESALKDYARIIRERDDVRSHAAWLEHELAQARRQVEELKDAADRVRDLQEKLDASLLAHGLQSTENARLKMRFNELDERVRQADQRAEATEASLKKCEGSLQGARDAREDAERRIGAALAALQPKK